VVLGRLQDPGNVGTIFRVAESFNATGCVALAGTAALYNAKTVRASAGSVFHLPLALEPDPAAAVNTARGSGLVVLAADGDGELDLDEADDLLAGPVAWLFGNEAWGLPPELGALADHRVRIPISGGAESLNLSTAAAICLHETARTRRRRLSP
jgi:TrmH family RNA methyltransferase